MDLRPLLGILSFLQQEEDGEDEDTSNFKHDSGCSEKIMEVFGKHVFIRHGDLNKEVPVITVFMSGKRKKNYAAVFAALLDLLSQDGTTPKVEEFMMDFEAAMWKACKEVFPTVKPVGCSFHLTQSFYRNFKLIGLGPSYRKDSQTRKTCRDLMSLYLLPAHKIAKRFEKIAEEANGLLLRFYNYIENTYINSTVWPPESWSMFMQHVRTNNNVKGTHNNLKAVAEPSSISLVTFLLKTKDEAEKIPMTAKLLSQKQVLRRLNKIAETKQHHLAALWDAYNRVEDSLSSKDLLEALGRLTKKHSRAELREIRNSENLDVETDVINRFTIK